jgi:hypothetical protein
VVLPVSSSSPAFTLLSGSVSTIRLVHVSVHGLKRYLGYFIIRFIRIRPVWFYNPTGADNTAPVTGLFYGGGFGVLEAQALLAAL